MLLLIVVIFFSFYMQDIIGAMFILEKDYQLIEIEWSLLDLNNQKSNFGQQFGVWTQYQPLNIIQPIGSVKSSESNCSLVIVARDDNQRINLLYYICFQYNSKTIIHKLKFFSNSNIIHESELIINSDVQYENSWYLCKVQYIPILNQIYALISNGDASYYQLLTISNEIYPFKSSSVQIQVGGSLIMDDPLFPEVSLLNSFQGRIWIINIQAGFVQIPFIQEKYISIQVSLQPNDYCQKDIIEITSMTLDRSFQISQSEPIQAQYSMSGWFKLTLESEEKIHVDFLSLKPINGFIEDRILEVTTTKLSYIIGKNINQLQITTYSYDFPLLSLDFENNNPFLRTYTIDSEVQFSQWHIIQLSRQLNQQEVKLIFQNGEQVIQYSKITNFNQFTGVTMKITFGSFLNINNQSNTSLQIYSLKFNNCQSSLQVLLCHFSCQTCNGPTQFDCQSCASNSFRELNPQIGTCQCLVGYMEQDKICLSNFDISITLKEMQQFQVTSTCQLGYFIYEGQCQECPQSIKSQQIFCIECIQNPLTWANSLKCSIQSLQVDQSVYSPISKTQIQFQLIQNELFHMVGCVQGYLLDKFKQRRCIECHLAYILKDDGTCEFNAYIEGKPVCTSLCKDCSYDQICISCIDPTLYYVSVNQPKICQLCEVKNCKYCFDYSLSNPKYNSYTFTYTSIQNKNYDDMVVGCAKCYSGFQFNFDTLQCEPVEESSCIQSIVKDQTQICLQTNLSYGETEAIQYGDCQQFINHCLSCIINKAKNAHCIQCEDGYYLIQAVGVCYLCTLPLAKNCQEHYSVIDYRIVVEASAFYAYLLPEKQIINIGYKWQFYYVFPISCIDGYEIYENNCIQQCPINCKKCIIIYESNICVSCEANNYGIQVRSIENNQCIQCPQYCELCVSQDQDLIKKQNPYFDQDPYLTYKCLKVKDDLDIFYIDPKFGFVEYCTTFDQCILEAQLTYLFITSKDDFNSIDQNYQYLNFRAVNTIQIMYILQNNIQYSQIDLQNYYKQNIYSINKTKIQIFGNSKVAQNLNLIISSYNEIQIYDIQLKITSQLQFLTNPLEYDYLNFYLSNSTIYSQYQNEIIVNFQLVQLQLFQIDQLLIDSIFVRNQKLINQFPYAQTNKITIIISNLIIQNSVFENVTIFNFNGNSGQQIDLLIQNLTLSNVTMINSQFINFQTSYSVILSIFNTIIQNCSLIYSKIIVQPQNSELIISDFVVKATQIFQSELCEFNTKVMMNNIKLMYLEIHNSKLFQLQNFYEQNSINFFLSNFLFEDSTYSNISIFDLYINNVLLVNIQFQHIQHLNVKQLGESTTQNLYVLLNYISLKDQLASSSYISILNFSVLSNEQNIKNIIKLNIECYDQLSEANLFLITGFQQVILQYMAIKHQLMIDRNVIKLYYSESLIEPNIFLSDLDFISNILLKQLNGQNLPFISITADIRLNITLQNLNFQNNFINYYIQQEIILGNLIHINCISGVIKILNLQLQTNLLSNSTSTMISISANSIQLTNIIASNLNNVDLNFFNYYLNLTEKSESLQDFYKQIFQTKSSYGIGILTAQDILLTDSIFEKVTSYSSSIFTIVGKAQFMIAFENLEIVNVTSSLMSEIAQYGCFLIDASRSQSLNVSVNRISVNYAINKLKSAFLTINPSNQNNVIMISNSKFLNVLSLKTSIFDLNLGNSNQEKNKIKILNVSIINEKEQLFTYFKMIQKLESYDLHSLLDMNAAILISSSFTQIQGLYVTGYYTAPVLEIVNCNSIQLFNLNFYKIFTLQALAIISSNQQNIQSLNIQDIKVNQVHQSSLATYNQNISLCPQYMSYSYFINQYCQIDYGDISVIYQQNMLGKQNKCDNQILSQLEQKLDGLIQISYSKLNYCNLRNLIFINVFCSQCMYGLLNMVLEELTPSINLFNIKCQNNTMSNYGCLYLAKISSDNQVINNPVTIYNSVFANNLCRSGCALTIVNFPLQLTNTLIIKNQASQNGGGILYLSTAFNLIMNSVYFIDNIAIIGSVIFIEQDIISEGLLNKSYIYNNTKLQIQENPTLISFYFSEVKIQGIENNNDIFYPDYQQISPVEYIFIPSNQYISEYQIFNSSSRIRQKANISLRFRAENQYNENIERLINTNCIVQSRDYNLTSQTPLSEFKNLGVIPFDTQSLSYNFDKTIFVINPYQKQEIIKQLQLQFPSISNQQQRYQLNLRSYYCQVGEYFVDDGCQLCQVQKGYYSVKANQSICQQRDINKIHDITESEIELYEGYWRPKYDSDQIEFCQKKRSVCKGGWKPGAESCEIGYIGSLCEECDLQDQMGNGNYLKVTGDEQCLACSISWRPVISMVLLSFWSILSINLITKSMQSSNKRFHELQRISNHYMILHKFNSDQASCLIKIALNQMLVISSIFTYQIGLQVNLSFIIDVSQASLSNSYNLDCILAEYSDSIQPIYLRLLVLLIIPFVYLNIFFLQYLLTLFFYKKKFQSSDLYTAIIYMIIITQPDIIKYCGSLLSSRSISGINWIQTNVSYLYETQRHQNWMYFFILPILFLWCIIIPSYFAYQLYKNRITLKFRKIRRKYCYLYNEYQETSYYWEIVKIIQRQLQILVLTLFDQNIIIKSSFLLIIQSVYLLVLNSSRPFNSEQVNKLELRSVILCIFIIIAAVCIFGLQNQDKLHLLYFFQVLLVVLVASNLIPIFVKLMYCYINQYFDKICLAFVNIQRSYPNTQRFFQLIFGKRYLKLQRAEIIKLRFAKVKEYLLHQTQIIIELKKQNFIYNKELQEIFDKQTLLRTQKNLLSLQKL